MPTLSRVRLLREIGACHADRARNRLSWARGAFQPIAICIIGAAVGLVAVALFLPLVDLINNLSR
jgi:type II secretory pathway component PulF